LAQPAHLAMFIRLECLFLVDRSWATAARAMRWGVVIAVVVLMAMADADTEDDDDDDNDVDGSRSVDDEIIRKREMK